MAIDIHKKPFDEGTKIKLLLFRLYLKEWLPVFLQSSHITTINIFDFFSGPGVDLNNTPGSPLIALGVIEEYRESIRNKKVCINLIFNEKNTEKYNHLTCELNGYSCDEITIQCYNRDFPVLFAETYHGMKVPGCANFIFLDQNGIKFISDDIFTALLALKRTDFMFFTSSSLLKRFKEHPNIKKHIDISDAEIDAARFLDIHRVVLKYYTGLIPNDKDYYLAPFSIKKKGNVYGIIFGSGHLLGIDKFLHVCWKIDPHTGEANYDIEGRGVNQNQFLLPIDEFRPNKVTKFEELLSVKILSRELKTNFDVYLETIRSGLTSDRAATAFGKMIESGKLPKQRIGFSYNTVRDVKNIKEIQLYDPNKN